MAPKINKLLSLLGKDKAGTNTSVSPRRQVVAFYGLDRDDQPRQADGLDTKFMEPYTGSSEHAEYTSHRVYIIEGAMLVWYLNIGSERYTVMRHRDMMVDNYLDSGGDLRTWRYIGVNGITNRVTHQLVMELFQARGMDIRNPCSVEVAPGDKEFADVVVGNPFTRGIQGLLREYEKDMGSARIKRLVFVTEYVRRRNIANPKCECHLVVELCRPGEDGYRRRW